MTTHRLRTAAGLAAGLALTLLGTACATPQTSTVPADAAPADMCPTPETSGTIRIGMSSPLAVFAPLVLADELDAFADAGLDVQVDRIPTADSLPLVAQGRLDAQATSFSAAHYNAVDSGVDMDFVMPFDTQKAQPPGAAVPGYWARKDVVGDAENPDFAALRGQEITSPTGGTGAAGKILNDALAPAGLNLQDIRLSVMVGPDALVGLQNGAVSAAWISAPLEIEAAKNPDLVPIAGYAPGVTGTSLVAGRSLLERPDVMVRFLQVMREVTDEHLTGDYRQDPETVRLLSEASETPEDVIRSSELLTFDPSFGMDGVDAYIDELQEFLLQREDLDYTEPIPATELTDGRFAEALSTCAPPAGDTP